MSLVVLRELVDAGSIPSSRVGKTLRRDMASLLAGGVLEERRSAGGRRMVVVSPDTFIRWIDQHYPNGLEVVPVATSRLEAIMHHGDSHRIAVGSPTVLVRALVNLHLIGPDGGRVNVRRRAAEIGALGINLATTSYTTEAPIAFIENKELYEDDATMRRLGYGRHLLVYSSGTPSSVLLTWLSQSGSPEIVHLPDYDATGMRDFLRLKVIAGDRAKIHVPSNFEDLVERYGSKRTAIDVVRHHRLLQSKDPQVAAIIAVLVRHGVGLEQEILRLN